MFKSFVFIASIALLPIAGQAQVYRAQEVTPSGFIYDISGGTGAGMATGTNHATLWAPSGVTDVHPGGYLSSAILGRTGQVGVGWGVLTPGFQVPLQWNGLVATTLPVPFTYLTGRAEATDGQQIVGTVTDGDPERGLGDPHAVLWDITSGSSIDLGKGRSATGVGGGRQVGVRYGSKGAMAVYWTGTKNSMQDLQPTFADVSVATDTNGVIETGYVGVDVRVFHEGRNKDIRFYSAGIWTGTPGSFQYLISPYRHSFAINLCGDTIVGYGNTTNSIGFPQLSRALAWVGPGHRFVNLHAYLPLDIKSSVARAVDEEGNISGYGVTAAGAVRSFIWHLL